MAHKPSNSLLALDEEAGLYQPESPDNGVSASFLHRKPTNAVEKVYLERPRTFGAVVAWLLCALPALIALTVIVATSGDDSSGGGGSKNSLDIYDFQVTSSLGAVAADDARCSRIGAGVLNSGGVAVDAAIATALCLGVVSAASSGIGGGAFIMVYNGTNAEFIDARETAPAAANETMFVENPELAQNGGLAVAVIGELRGMWLAHHRHGKSDWKQLFEPAISLAEKSQISAKMAQSIQTNLDLILQFDELASIYAPGGKPLQAGDYCYQPKLAETLRKVSEHGPDVIYDGELSAGLVADIQAAGGIITEADLAGYQPVIRNPLELDVFGYHMYGAPPPSSGGSAVFAVLNYLEGYMQPFAGVGNLAYHRMAEGIKHAFAMRMNLGDPDYVDVDDVVNDMLSKEFMGGLRENSSDDTTLPLDEYGGKWNQLTDLEDHGTTHLSVIDKWGNVVSMTSTINTAFGSKVVSPSTGILLNDQMDDFSIPGVPNAFGLEPSPENYVAPGKRPLSSMSPTVVLEKGKVRMIAGASGGPMIITATTQVLVNHLLRGWDLATAVSAPRLHSQLLPDELYCESVTLVNGFYVYLPDDVRASLAMRNHNIANNDYLGVSQSIVIDQDTGVITAVSDYRKDGRPAPQTV